MPQLATCDCNAFTMCFQTITAFEIIATISGVPSNPEIMNSSNYTLTH